jgi:signal transduction histidine kinase
MVGDFMIIEDDYKNLNENDDNIKGEFLENMSHEIRTPLNVIIGFSEILYSQISDIRQKNYIKAINTAGNDLLNLINDILDLCKIEAGQIENLEKKKMLISDKAMINKELLKEMSESNRKNMDNYNIYTDIYDMKLPVQVESEFIEEVLPLVDKLKVGIKGNIAKELSSMLINIGRNYNVEVITNMGRLFSEAVECFDIIKINEYLKLFEKWITIIKQREVGKI